MKECKNLFPDDETKSVKDFKDNYIVLIFISTSYANGRKSTDVEILSLYEK